MYAMSLVAMDWVQKQERLFRWLQWFTVLIILALAVTNFIAAASPHVKKNIILSHTIPRFWLGVAMSAINPAQIPFWFGWSTALYTKRSWCPVTIIYNAYICRYWPRYLSGQCCLYFRRTAHCKPLKRRTRA